MNPDTIELSNLTKSFEYVKFSNQIDSINDIEDLRNLAKCYFKLYLKQQEIVSEWSVSKP
jgi:putative heme degradation protein|tara:strand:- start:204 stop:383 length:180 start_codon:yes stop_codon:yes gene_type:complete